MLTDNLVRLASVKLEVFRDSISLAFATQMVLLDLDVLMASVSSHPA